MKLVRGTRFIDTNEAKTRRVLFEQLRHIAEQNAFQEVVPPTIEFPDLYIDKAGSEVLDQMYVFADKKGRDICLRPEVTATIQDWYKSTQNGKKDIKVWYFNPCYRYERPQKGRQREFWQFGLEWLSPRDMQKASDLLVCLAKQMVELTTNDYNLNTSAKRGLDYYIGDGFEISVDKLGSQKQVCGGGAYDLGIGFAVGFERLALCLD